MTRIKALIAAVLLTAAFAQPRAAAPADVFFSKTSRFQQQQGAGNLQGTGAAVDLTAGVHRADVTTAVPPPGGLFGGHGGQWRGLRPGAERTRTRPSSRRPISSTAAAGSTGTMRWLWKGGAAGTVIDAIGQIGIDPGAEWGSGLASTVRITP